MDLSTPRRVAVHSAPRPFTATERVLLAIAAAVYVVVRLVHIPSFRLWFDEIFTMEVGRRDWGSLLWFVKNYDVHPPLFYVLVKLWMAIGGESFVWLGLFSALTAIAALLPIYALARELTLHPPEMIVALALMAFNGYLTGYAQEFRAYDSLLLVSVTSLWLFVRWCNTGGTRTPTLIALGVVNLMLVYLHYYGWLVVGTEGLFLLYWQWRLVAPFAATAAIALAAYAPWAYLVVQAASHRVAAGDKALFFIPKPTAFSVAFFYGALNGLFDVAHTTLAGVVLFAAPVAIWAWHAMRGSGHRAPARHGVDTRGTLVWLVLFAVTPVVVAFVASRVLPTGIWGQRHLIVVATPYYMLVAVALLRLRTGLVRTAWTAVALVWAVAAGVAAQRAPYKTPAWDSLVATIVAETPPGRPTRVYAMSEDAAFPMQFYLARTGRTDIDVAVVLKDTPKNRARFQSDSKKPYWALTVPVVLVNSPSDLGSDPFWVCVDQDAAPIGFPGRPLSRIFAEAGYAVGPERSATLVNRRWNVRTVGVFPVARELAASR